MAAGNLNIAIEQGATFSMTLFLKDELDAALDLTGHTFRGQVRLSLADAAPLGAFSFTVLDQTQVGTKGKVEVVMSATVTAQLPTAKSGPGQRKDVSALYDIESETLSGVVRRWLQGVATISPEATK